MLIQHSLGVLQESQTGGIFPTRIFVREVRADVPKSGGAQQRVANRVRQDIAIGMADRAFVERYFDASDHELAVCREPVQIVTDSGLRHFAACPGFADLVWARSWLR